MLPGEPRYSTAKFSSNTIVTLRQQNLLICRPIMSPHHQFLTIHQQNVAFRLHLQMPLKNIVRPDEKRQCWRTELFPERTSGCWEKIVFYKIIINHEFSSLVSTSTSNIWWWRWTPTVLSFSKTHYQTLLQHYPPKRICIVAMSSKSRHVLPKSIGPAITAVNDNFRQTAAIVVMFRCMIDPWH